MKVALLALTAGVACANIPPIAPHMTQTIEAGSENVVTLSGYDVDGNALTTTIESLPAEGTLYQLSAVFSDYGYEPRAGTALAAGDVVTGSKNRVVYVRPDNDVAPAAEFASFTYSVNDGTVDSDAGIVRFVHSSEVLVASDFYSSDESWTVEGNRAAGETPVHESASRGLLNHYVYATDNDVHVDKATGADQSRWVFSAPDEFLGNQGLAYGGSLEFLMSSFAGDYSASNLNDELEFVALECSQCNLNKGVRLVRFLGDDLTFAGTTTQFDLALTEDDGWLIDPRSTIGEWVAPTQCQIIEVLSGLSSVEILGDVTARIESVALDAVQLKHGSGIPICAQRSADASVCDC